LKQKPIGCKLNKLHNQPVRQTGSGPSPAHDIASTSVLVPISFGAFTGTLTNSSGTVIQQSTDPPATKGNSQGAGSSPINCTFTFSNSFTVTQSGGDLPPGTYTFTGSGSATGFIPSQK
jgi:hypothetical protein